MMSDPPAAVTGGEASPDRPAPADRGKLLTNAPAAAAYDPGRPTSRLRTRAGLRPPVGPDRRNRSEVQPADELGPHGTAAAASVARRFRPQHR